ncbi:MAG: Cell wall-associated hydrolase [Verrucomicrobiota bacterium]|jgi:cell wall-associated NlpC family hydrolase
MLSKVVTFILAAALSAAAAPKASKAAGKRTSAAQSYDDDGSDDRSTPVQIGAQATLNPTDLAEFGAQSPMAQKFINGALHLTKCRLSYRFGSADPANGGMDCSGTIHFLLRYMGLKNPPRDASSIYLWTQYHGTLRECDATDLNDPQLRGLRPGDLLFWEGTYDVNRNPPISHAMVYLGREKATGAPVMAGASDGRRYRGVKRNGVSVFDFTLPKPGSRARFVGYARVPGL